MPITRAAISAVVEPHTTLSPSLFRKVFTNFSSSFLLAGGPDRMLITLALRSVSTAMEVSSPFSLPESDLVFMRMISSASSRVMPALTHFWKRS